MRVSDVDPNYPPEMWPKFWSELKRQRALQFETTHQRRNGEAYPCEIRIRYMEFDGTAFGFVRAEDLTERHATEARLRRAQFAMDNALDAVFWVRDDGSFSYTNKQASAQLGYSDEELSRMTIHNIMPTLTPDAWREQWCKTRDSGTDSEESSHRRKDGTQYDCHVTRHFLSFENEEFILSTVRNITHHKRAEARTQSATRQARSLSAIVEQSRNEVYVFDTESLRFKYVNHGALENIGYTLEEMLARTPVDIKPYFDRATFEAMLRPLRDKLTLRILLRT